MHNGKYKSIKDLMSRLLRNPLMSNLNESDVASYVGDAIRFIQAPLAYDEKVVDILIEDHRGELPCDIIYIQQTQKYKEGLNEGKPESTYNRMYGYLPMRYATDHFHTALHADNSPDLQKNGYTEHDYDVTYKIQSDYIYTSFKEGKVRMSYRGLKLDNDGYPMIPDNVAVEKAMENHVMYEHYRILWQLGKIPDKVYNEVKQERDWYIGSANTKLQLQNIDQAESMKAAFTRSILKPLQHGAGFKDFGTQEYLNRGSI